MRTTLNVDEELFEDLMRFTDAKTKTEAVRKAITEFVRLKRKQKLLSLRGKVDMADNWRELREREMREAKSNA